MNNQFFRYLKKNYFNFEGRATAQEYWHFNAQIALHFALAFVAFAVLEAVSLRLRETDLHLQLTLWLAAAGFLIAALVLALPSMALSVRRLHDMNLSGWWLLLPLGLAAALGPYKWVVPIGVMLFLLRRGGWSANKYGPVPDFDKTRYMTLVQRLWQGGLATKTAIGASLAGLVYVGFYLPITGAAPTDRAGGLTEYQLIDRGTGTHWALLFPAETPVKRPESAHYFKPSVGGRRPVASPNQRMTVTLSRDQIAVGDGDAAFVEVVLWAKQRSSHRSFGSDHRDRCHRGQEIAPGVFALQDVPQSEAERAYEVGSQKHSFEEFYERQYANRCVRPDGPFASRYIVTSSTDQTIGYGNCFTRNTKCRFSFENPFDRTAYYDLDLTKVKDISAIHQGVVRYLAGATDRESSSATILSALDTLTQEPFNPAEFVPSPSFSALEIDPASVPSDGFRQVISDRASPGAAVRETNVSSILINVGHRGHSGVKSDRFAAYWVGKRTFAEPTRQMISLDASRGLSIVRINGETVYRYSPRTVTGADIQNALNTPVFVNGDVSVGFVPGNPRPENPFLVEFPAGDSIIEVEFINDAHVAEVMLTIGDEITPLTRNAARNRLGSANLQDADIYYFGVYESSRPDGRITVRLPDTFNPAVLILDSFAGVTWELETDRNVVATIVGSVSPVVKFTGADFGDIIHLNDPIRMHDETRDCECRRGNFRCDSNVDLVDVATIVENLTGYPLSGYAMDYNIGLMKVTDYTPRVQDRIRQLRMDDAALRATCE